ncbi:MAG: gliding motility-associated C-terminal domain-containing protein [Bacteroidota bacterium]
MKGSFTVTFKCLFLSLLVITGFIEPLFPQTSISGVVNQYARVTGIGVDYVVIENETQFDKFAPGDTVLLMQMKGERIIPSGTGEWEYGKTGRYEFLTVSECNNGTNTIVFRSNIINTSFSLPGVVQLIKVPSFNYAVVGGTLTCQPWDSLTKTGGVLSAIISRTLVLNADIDVTGKGFKGGAVTLGKGICINSNVSWDKLNYSATSDSAGLKGEGLAILVDKGIAPYIPVYPEFGKGKAPSYNGGGGGNGRFSGGGGGGNYGTGGSGGRESNQCSPNLPGALFSNSVVGSPKRGGFFLGAGGGGSTYLSGGSPVPGGNGGGIIFLICDTLKGNGHSIIANGEFPGTASGTAGAGGGGAGGSIAIYLQSYSGLSTSALTISAKGGNGGNYAGTPLVNAGEGGGGGGGFINTSDIIPPSNVNKLVSGGNAGNRGAGTVSSTSGTAGRDSSTFKPVLNGFLFNSIRSTATGNQVDSICSNVIPPVINGTNPAGTGPFTYLWQKNYDLSGAPSVIAGATSRDYTPAIPEADTFWIRRVVTDNGAVPLVITDTSKWVKIIVQPAITGNLVGEDTTICYGQDPLSLIPLNTGPAEGNGRYQYQWVQNSNDADWSSPATASGTSDLSSYDPSSLTTTTYYKRIVTSGRCVDRSATVTITVLPSITGNVTSRPDSVICEGQLFNTLSSSAPGGGSGTYVYLWQDSTASGVWAGSPSVNSGTTYTPDTLTFAVTEQRYYRRVVFSGPDSVCRSNSAPILMSRYHYIENNTISKDTTICSGSVPPALTGSTPLKGSGIYTYIWQDSSTASWTPRGTSLSPYAPSALTDTTWYRRIVNSSKCADTSKTLVINVHKPISNNIASLLSGADNDTTICSGATPNRIKGSIPAGGTDIPGDFAYQWSYSTDNISYTDIAAVSATSTDYQPESLTTTTWFRRRVLSGKCSSESDPIQMVVLPSIINNTLSADQTICYGTTPAQIAGSALTGGAGGIPTWKWEESNDGTTWLTAEGVSTEQNYSPLSLTIQMKYRRIILSGPYNCCIDTSAITHVSINPLPTGAITSVTDTTICGGSEVALKLSLTGAANWKVVYEQNSDEVTVDNISSAGYTIKDIPVISAAMSTFSYSLLSVQDNNGCFATSLSGTRKADVYRVPVAEAGPDDEVCGPEYRLAAVRSDGTGSWIFPPEVIESVPADPLTSIKIDSSFTDQYREYKFYWKEVNWQCESKDSVKIKFWNRIKDISAGCDTALYSFDYKMELNACPIETFETGEWGLVAGTGSFDDPDSCTTIVRGISKGLNTYKWRVTNGVCLMEALVNVDLYDVSIPEGFSPNNDPENYNNTFVIRGLDIHSQVAELTIVNSAGSKVFHTTNRDGKEWKDWDGKNSAGIDMPEGTYYYILKIVSDISVFPPASGFIILKRY